MRVGSPNLQQCFHRQATLRDCELLELLLSVTTASQPPQLFEVIDARAAGSHPPLQGEGRPRHSASKTRVNALVPRAGWGAAAG
jgi:hypothetical protein